MLGILIVTHSGFLVQMYRIIRKYRFNPKTDLILALIFNYFTYLDLVELFLKLRTLLVELYNRGS